MNNSSIKIYADLNKKLVDLSHRPQYSFFNTEYYDNIACFLEELEQAPEVKKWLRNL